MKTATREASLFPHITAKPCTDPSHSSGEIHLHAASPLGEPSVNLSLRAGELAVVIGTTGSGKSRLLGALSNPSRRGSTASLHGGCAHGSVALVLQQPFLLNASVRDNILFGLPLEEVRMQEALARTELVPDMAALPRGVLTMVGPSGVQLSGGQKARVCLARALYADADCYLLDDILSAVD
ncbi:P-loop containing nucleoside triphosphate hydrolase protein, partial [Chytriomyces sp. MP71]